MRRIKERERKRGKGKKEDQVGEPDKEREQRARDRELEGGGAFSVSVLLQLGWLLGKVRKSEVRLGRGAATVVVLNAKAAAQLARLCGLRGLYVYTCTRITLARYRRALGHGVASLDLSVSGWRRHRRSDMLAAWGGVGMDISRPARQRTKSAFDVGTEEGEPEPEPEPVSSRPATPSPAWPSPASEPLLSPAANLNRNDQNPPLEGVSVAGPELWPSGDWSSAIALPATHGRRRRARVSSALAKTCMRSRITPTGSGRVLQLFLPYSANGADEQDAAAALGRTSREA